MAHPPMARLALPSLVTWLSARLWGDTADSAMLCRLLPQGALIGAAVGHDLADGSPYIDLTTQTIKPAKISTAGGVADPKPPRTRRWDPEAFLCIRLALLNGNTMFVDSTYDKTSNDGEGFHYPEFYGEGILVHRVLMDAKPGDGIYQVKNLPHEVTHKDCRLRYFSRSPGQQNKRGRSEFLEVAAKTYARRHYKMSGEERFGLTEREYLKLLEQALDLNWLVNSPEATDEPRRLAIASLAGA